ncbi:MAG TPA: hypothetical protein VF796_14285 [Humisphaera sp.]
MATRERISLRAGTLADVPAAAVLRELTGRERTCHVRVEGGRELPDDEVRLVISRLADSLPDHSVFWSGDGVTAVPVISEAEVLAHSDPLVDAARHFRGIAEDLMERLARRFGVPVGAFSDIRRRPWARPARPGWRRALALLVPGRSRRGNLQRGDVDREWTYCFHGYQCAFASRSTGQVLDVELGYGDEFGVLDPQFFTRYLETTARCDALRRLFRDDYHDPAKAIDVLARHGHLRTVLPDPRWPRGPGVAAAPGHR